jgi:hypothetical protein
MVQCRGRASFLQEAPLTLRIGDLIVWQNLDRDCPVQASIGGSENLTHATSPEFGLDFVRPE